jgi:hypothetical protein
MPISKGQLFNEQDVYIDYDFEEVMYRYDYKTRKRYVKFYGKKESSRLVPHDNRLYNDALLYGEQITKEKYIKGKPRR